MKPNPNSSYNGLALSIKDSNPKEKKNKIGK